MSNFNSLADLGWQPFFQQQLCLEEWDQTIPARIIEQHKSRLCLATADGIIDLEIRPNMPPMTVGDWLLLNHGRNFVRLLERKTCFSRKSAGSELKQQLISANVDTAFIVTSMNEDFNLNRLERFLALVNQAGAEPVILLSKSDICVEPERFVQAVRSLDALLMVEAVNCLDPNSLDALQPWLKHGATVAVLGSSGVGKSTLVNSLLGGSVQATGAIRADDAKGRHTTTSRSLLSLASGSLILDTPGMREIQLAQCEAGLSTTFADIEALAQSCRYSDCQHQSEPGCAVQAAIEVGELDSRRLSNYFKLLREEALNSASLADKRASDKALDKFYKRTQQQASKLKGR